MQEAESTLGPRCCGNENSNRTLDLAACGAVPQPSALSHSPDRCVEIETYVRCMQLLQATALPTVLGILGVRAYSIILLH